MGRPKRQKRLTGKPVLLDKLDPELGGKLVEAVTEDMARAKESRAKRRRAAEAAGAGPDGPEDGA